MAVKINESKNKEPIEASARLESLLDRVQADLRRIDEASKTLREHYSTGLPSMHGERYGLADTMRLKKLEKAASAITPLERSAFKRRLEEVAAILESLDPDEGLADLENKLLERADLFSNPSKAEREVFLSPRDEDLIDAAHKADAFKRIHEAALMSEKMNKYPSLSEEEKEGRSLGDMETSLMKFIKKELSGDKEGSGVSMLEEKAEAIAEAKVMCATLNLVNGVREKLREAGNGTKSAYDTVRRELRYADYEQYMKARHTGPVEGNKGEHMHAEREDAASANKPGAHKASEAASHKTEESQKEKAAETLTNTIAIALFRSKAETITANLKEIIESGAVEDDMVTDTNALNVKMFAEYEVFKHAIDPKTRREILKTLHEVNKMFDLAGKEVHRDVNSLNLSGLSKTRIKANIDDAMRKEADEIAYGEIPAVYHELKDFFGQTHGIDIATLYKEYGDYEKRMLEIHAALRGKAYSAKDDETETVFPNQLG